MISSVLSAALLAVCIGLLMTHFADIKKSHKRNG